MRKWAKIGIISFIGICVFINVVAIFHSYKFTHFYSSGLKAGTQDQLSQSSKIKALFLGIDLARPENQSTPTKVYKTIHLKSNKEIECWQILVPGSKGTVVMFHGYGGSKSSLLDKSNILNDLGYNTLLVDFMGSGGSEGNQTTIGFKESEEVKTCYQFLKDQNENNIYLFGTSMGAVAIMKCIHDTQINPKGIILECPFGTMYKTVCKRFDIMNIPSFPMAGLLVFWGGIQNGFWAFGHNPIGYAQKITCPTLLLYGERDDRVTREEIDKIYTNIPGPKQLKTYPNAGHSNYLQLYQVEWTRDVNHFLNMYP